MDRLQKLSEDLYGEFDGNSPNYWGNNKNRYEGLSKTLEHINVEFDANRTVFAKEKVSMRDFPLVISVIEMKMHYDLRAAESDPFIPANIRDRVKDLLDNRLDMVQEADIEVCDFYIGALASGTHAPCRLKMSRRGFAIK
jgi:hypothetical protein